MAGSDQNARVTDVVAPQLAPLGLVLDEVRVTPAGNRRLVRISIDRETATIGPDDHTSVIAPLSLDEVAEATRAISAALDDTEPLGDTPYVLEVSSPGVSRPLILPRHFRRNVGRQLELTLAAGGTLVGRLVAAGPDGLSVRTADGAVRVLAVADVSRGRVQVEFTRGPAADATDLAADAMDSDEFQGASEAGADDQDEEI